MNGVANSVACMHITAVVIQRRLHSITLVCKLATYNSTDCMNNGSGFSVECVHVFS